MYNAPRAATIKCKTTGKMYGMDRSTFTNIIQEAAMKKRKANMDVLKKVDIFQDVDPYEKEQVCDVLVEETYSKGDYIVKQGDSGDKFYIVTEGKLIAEK
jgi:cAMP-dependent protein kinase regulator